MFIVCLLKEKFGINLKGFTCVFSTGEVKQHTVTSFLSCSTTTCIVLLRCA